jgi:hypothetical protein
MSVKENIPDGFGVIKCFVYDKTMEYSTGNELIFWIIAECSNCNSLNDHGLNLIQRDCRSDPSHLSWLSFSILFDKHRDELGRLCNKCGSTYKLDCPNKYNSRY